MLPENRKEHILKLLEQKPFVTVSELSEEFGLSEVSVRKLLISMEDDGLLKRSWGGAVKLSNTLREYSHREKSAQNLQEKKAIAKIAYDFINDGEAIFMDSGTTTMELAKLICNGEKRNILVSTNAINIAMEFCDSPDIEVIIIGGQFRHRILCCTSNLALDMLGKLYFDKVFITGNHFTVERGYTTPITQEAEFKNALFSAGKVNYVLMDYSKFGENSLCQIAPIDCANFVITDWHAPETLVQEFKKHGVEMIRAPKSEQ